MDSEPDDDGTSSVGNESTVAESFSSGAADAVDRIFDEMVDRGRLREWEPRLGRPELEREFTRAAGQIWRQRRSAQGREQADETTRWFVRTLGEILRALRADAPPVPPPLVSEDGGGAATSAQQLVAEANNSGRLRHAGWILGHASLEALATGMVQAGIASFGEGVGLLWAQVIGTVLRTAVWTPERIRDEAVEAGREEGTYRGQRNAPMMAPLRELAGVILGTGELPVTVAEVAQAAARGLDLESDDDVRRAVRAMVAMAEDLGTRADRVEPHRTTVRFNGERAETVLAEAAHEGASAVDELLVRRLLNSRAEPLSLFVHGSSTLRLNGDESPSALRNAMRGGIADRYAQLVARGIPERWLPRPDEFVVELRPPHPSVEGSVMRAVIETGPPRTPVVPLGTGIGPARPALLTVAADGSARVSPADGRDGEEGDWHVDLRPPQPQRTTRTVPSSSRPAAVPPVDAQRQDRNPAAGGASRVANAPAQDARGRAADIVRDMTDPEMLREQARALGMPDLAAELERAARRVERAVEAVAPGQGQEVARWFTAQLALIIGFASDAALEVSLDAVHADDLAVADASAAQQIARALVADGNDQDRFAAAATDFGAPLQRRTEQLVQIVVARFGQPVGEEATSAAGQVMGTAHWTRARIRAL
ncbi:MAG: hypothetical protein LBV60_26760, partial [Streptomyces sp.]|nr:hypothetical protein [Streptomyces sp.]